MLRPNNTSSNKKYHAVAQLIEAQRYKPKLTGLIPDGSLTFLIDLILPAALCPWGSTQPLTEMSTKGIFRE